MSPSKPGQPVKLAKVERVLKHLSQVSSEISYKNCFEDEHFSSGLIAFGRRKKSDSKQINHDAKDVVCYVLKGRGRLRIRNRRIALRPGIICHIPKNTPHDFAAGKTGKLLLFYSLIKTA